MDSINNKVNENIPFFQGQFRDFCKKVEQFAEHLMKCARDKNLKYDWEAFNALRKEKGKLALRITELYDKYDQAQKANYYKKAENYHNQIKKLEDQHSKLPYDITAPEKGCILFSYLNNSYPDINKKEDGFDYPLQQFWVTPKVVNPLSWFMKGTPENLSEENRLMHHCVILSVAHDYNENLDNADQRIYRLENYTGRFKRDRFCSNLWYKLSNDQERVNRSLQFVIKYLDNIENEEKKTKRSLKKIDIEDLIIQAGSGPTDKPDKVSKPKTEIANKSGNIKEPSKEAQMAYRLYWGSGNTQTEVAKIMTDRLNRPVNQGQVSRWVNEYTDWRKDVGIPVDDKKPNIITNSNILDLGARTDGRITGDPRHKRTSNADYGENHNQ